MSNKVDQRVVDLGYDIIRDSKRRTLYYDEKTKKGYQVQTKDIKWIRLYKLRFFIGLIVYFLLFMFFREVEITTRFFLTFLAGLIVYLIISLLFEKLFLKDKIPFKISQTDFNQRFETEVLYQKRMLNRFHLGFVFIYGLLVLIEFYASETNIWIIMIFVLLFIGMLTLFIRKLLALREQIKISKQKTV